MNDFVSLFCVSLYMYLSVRLIISVLLISAVHGRVGGSFSCPFADKSFSSPGALISMRAIATVYLWVLSCPRSLRTTFRVVARWAPFHLRGHRRLCRKPVGWPCSLWGWGLVGGGAPTRTKNHTTLPITLLPHSIARDLGPCTAGFPHFDTSGTLYMQFFLL